MATMPVHLWPSFHCVLTLINYCPGQQKVATRTERGFGRVEWADAFISIIWGLVGTDIIQWVFTKCSTIDDANLIWPLPCFDSRGGKKAWCPVIAPCHPAATSVVSSRHWQCLPRCSAAATHSLQTFCCHNRHGSWAEMRCGNRLRKDSGQSLHTHINGTVSPPLCTYLSVLIIIPVHALLKLPRRQLAKACQTLKLPRGMNHPHHSTPIWRSRITPSGTPPLKKQK